MPLPLPLPLPATARAILIAAVAAACGPPRSPVSATATAGDLRDVVVVPAATFAEARALVALPGGDRVLAVDFAGALTLGGAHLAGLGASDALLARIGGGGAVRWVLPLTGPGADSIPAVTATADGGLLVAGRAGAGARLGERSLAGGGFLASVDADGRPGALTEIPGDVWLAGVAAAADGSRCAAGWFTGAIGGDAGPLALHSAGSQDALVVCTTPEGTPAWARRAGGSGADQATALVVDGDQLVVVGGFSQLADFDGTELAATRGRADGFAAAWSLADGTPRWRVGFGGPAVDAATAVTRADDGTIWLAGTFTDSAMVGGAVLESDGEGALVAAVGADGRLHDARAVGRRGADATAVVTMGGQLVVAGTFAGGAEIAERRLEASGGRDLYLAGYPGGWVVTLGGHDQDGVAALAVRGNQLLLAGSFADDLISGSATLHAPGQAAFTASLSRTPGGSPPR